MITDRYYYNHLTQREQKIYNALYKGVMAQESQISVPETNISDDEFNRVFKAFSDDNPFIYYFNQSTMKIMMDNLGHSFLIPQYFYKPDKIKKYSNNLQKAVNDLIYQLHLDQGTDFEKEKRLHDYMCEYIKYDHKGDDLSNPERVICSHNVIGVLAKKTAQCEGIAKATKLILNAVDVHCIVVSGAAKDKKRGKEPHAWNLVNLDGKAYHLDTTWDIGASSKNAIGYDYFNVTDQMISKNHVTDLDIPICQSEDMNYFTLNQTVFDKKKQIEAYILDGIEHDKNDFYFRLSGRTKVEKILPELVQFSLEKQSEKLRKGCKAKSSVNADLNIGRITLL